MACSQREAVHTVNYLFDLQLPDVIRVRQFKKAAVLINLCVDDVHLLLHLHA